MKSTAPPLRASRWPARRRSTAPGRSPSAAARLGLGAQRAQRLAEARPRSGRAPSRPARRRGARRPRSAASRRARVQRRAVGVARAARSAICASQQQARPRALGGVRLRAPAAARARVAARRAATAPAAAPPRARRARCRSGCCAPAPAPSRTRRRHAPSRAAGVERARSRTRRAACRRRCRSRSRVERLPAAQRVDAGVHQHACARLRQRVCSSTLADAAQRARRCRARDARLADALGRQRVAAQVGEAAAVVEARRPGPASRTSRPCRRARSRRRSCTCEADAVGLALHVAREVELALHRCRLAAGDRRLRRVGAVARGWPRAGRAISAARPSSDWRLAAGDAARDVALRDVRQLVRRAPRRARRASR